MKANSGNKMLNELIDDVMNEEDIKNFNDYCKKLDEAQRRKPFMIVSEELGKELNNIK